MKLSAGQSYSISLSPLLLLLLAHSSTASSAQADLQRRADCRTTKVQQNDGCQALADRCSITLSQFRSYNNNGQICDTAGGLQPDQLVCCSSGTLPSNKPTPGSDGSCFAYYVNKNEDCSTIGAKYGLSVAEIEKFNGGADRTWGWSGCGANLKYDMNICLSTGTPPLPAPVGNAVCGPTMPGTQKPANGQSLASLNPCKLNACCNIWGQCGATPDFCTVINGPTGNPGTSPPGQNGCISNCGIYIANVKQPTTQVNVAYFESWNWDRPCNNMRVTDIDTNRYTHIHWAFVDVDPKTFKLIPNNTWGQWDSFKSLTNIRKIVSIGGWGFSTDLKTYDILRNAMYGNNNAIFAQNIVDFLNQHNLDGIDIDWEYASSPDNQGNPALPSKGPDSDVFFYYLLLQKLRELMPFGKGKSVSIAAPASLWYLRAFPIELMATQLDYIVYMTYDLHGQWDYDNKWAMEGCPAGNCLRSHINSTETAYALALITKAGVSTDKIVVGVTSYGRAFGMTVLCTGPMCTFKGKESAATPGFCTGTPGYVSNAEIEYIKGFNDFGFQSWYDQASDSDMMRYGAGQWVAYMTDITKARRASQYRAYNFLGTADWAVSLGGWSSVDGRPDLQDTDDWDNEQPSDPLPACDASYSSFDAIIAASPLPKHCAGKYFVNAMSATLDDANSRFNTLVKNNYDKKFNTYAKAVVGGAEDAVVGFMNKRGNEFFSCVVEEQTYCCSKCSFLGGGKAPQDPCRRCHNQACYVDGAKEPPHKRGEASLGSNQTSIDEHDSLRARDQIPNMILVKVNEPCPPDYSQRGPGPSQPEWLNKVWWTIQSGKSDAFWAAISSDTGIPASKLKMGDKDPWYGRPLVNGYGTGDVTNPKTTVMTALAKSGTLKQQLTDAAFIFQSGFWEGDPSEYIDAITLPVAMIKDGVDQMNSVDETATSIDEAKRKSIIIAVFSALLFIIPVAGQALGSVAGMSGLAAMMVAFGAIGEVAMGTYSLISDPSDPVGGILQIVLAPTVLADIPAISRASQLRRGTDSAKIAKMGKTVDLSVQAFQKTFGVCKKL